MAPKEKAEQLLNIMSNQTYKFQEYAGARLSTEILGYEAGKKCAMVAVDEVINTLFWQRQIDYWEEVKKELEKL
jgi:hypothetical protein